MASSATVKRAGSLEELFRFGGSAEVAVEDSSSATQASNEATAARLIVLSGALTAARTVVLQQRNAGADWIVYNATDGGYAVTVRGPTGAGLEVPAGRLEHVVSNGAALARSVTPAIAVVDIGANANVPALTTEQARASVVVVVGYSDGSGQEVTFPNLNPGDDHQTTIVNLTQYRVSAVFPATATTLRVPAGATRTFLWSGGAPADSAIRTNVERAAGVVVRVTSAGAVEWTPDEDIAAGATITKNGPGDHTVDFAGIAGILSTMKAASVSPNGAAAVASSVELLGDKSCRVRLGADVAFTLTAHF